MERTTEPFCGRCAGSDVTLLCKSCHQHFCHTCSSLSIAKNPCEIAVSHSLFPIGSMLKRSITDKSLKQTMRSSRNSTSREPIQRTESKEESRRTYGSCETCGPQVCKRYVWSKRPEEPECVRCRCSPQKHRRSFNLRPLDQKKRTNAPLMEVIETQSTIKENIELIGKIWWREKNKEWIRKNTSSSDIKKELNLILNECLHCPPKACGKYLPDGQKEYHCLLCGCAPFRHTNPTNLGFELQYPKTLNDFLFLGPCLNCEDSECRRFVWNPQSDEKVCAICECKAEAHEKLDIHPASMESMEKFLSLQEREEESISDSFYDGSFSTAFSLTIQNKALFHQFLDCLTLPEDINVIHFLSKAKIYSKLFEMDQCYRPHTFDVILSSEQYGMKLYYTYLSRKSQNEIHLKMKCTEKVFSYLSRRQMRGNLFFDCENFLRRSLHTKFSEFYRKIMSERPLNMANRLSPTKREKIQTLLDSLIAPLPDPQSRNSPFFSPISSPISFLPQLPISLAMNMSTTTTELSPCGSRGTTNKKLIQILSEVKESEVIKSPTLKNYADGEKKSDEPLSRSLSLSSSLLRKDSIEKRFFSSILNLPLKLSFDK
jgi:hypothetical protein